MPRFHFHVRDGRSFPDRDGTELPDAASARREALRLMGELMAQHPESFQHVRQWQVEVTDAAGERLYMLGVAAEDGGD